MLRTTVRGVLQSGAPDLVAALRELGWDELAAEEPVDSATVLFEEQGHLLVSSRALDVVVASALGLDDRDVAIAYPEPGTPTVTSAIDGDGRLTVKGVRFSAPSVGEVAVPALVEKDIVVAIVDRDALSAVEMEGFDPDLGLERVGGVIEPGGYRMLDEGAWVTAVAVGRRALAHELVGLAAHMIELTASYVKEREQFGRPIGTFQAVQHRLADAHVGVVSARSVLEAIEPDDAVFGSDLAKAVAGRAALRAGHSCVQVSGAIGCTWEYELHRYLRRTHALDGLLGSWRTLRTALGQRMVEQGRASRLGVAPEGPTA